MLNVLLTFLTYPTVHTAWPNVLLLLLLLFLLVIGMVEVLSTRLHLLVSVAVVLNKGKDERSVIILRL